MSLELEREQTVQTLCQQFAHDQLSTQDLEKRLEAVYRASSPEELRALVAGLPALRTPPQAVVAPREAPMRTDAMREQRVLAVFGSARKRGEWEPAEHTRGLAVFGELELDFRDALIPMGITNVAVSAAFGTVRVVVPPGLHVECNGSAIMGTFSEKTFLSAQASADAPTLRITGMAVFGEVKVVVRLPAETAMEAFTRERGR
jgi:hypothetical protein